MAYRVRTGDYDPELAMSWGGIFEKEKKTMSKFTEEKIKDILSHPSQSTDGFENRYLIYRMLQALYQRQTEQEKSHSATKVTNGIGFNKFDAAFLTDVAKKSKKYKNLTWGQAVAVGKSLQKYRKQLLEISASYKPAPKVVEPPKKTLDAVSPFGDDELLTSPLDSKDITESNFGEGDDNILDASLFD